MNNVWTQKNTSFYVIGKKSTNTNWKPKTLPVVEKIVKIRKVTSSTQNLNIVKVAKQVKWVQTPQICKHA